MTDRLETWNKVLFEEELQKLPPRIQREIKTIESPTIKEVKSTYLFGKVGTGKTIYAVFMMLHYLKQSYLERKTSSAIFITTPELLFEIKRSYSQNSITEEEIVDKYSKIPLLVLDDFGVERTTDWSFQLLYIIINRRYENDKLTIFTSNLSLDQLSEKLQDDRIPSRIQQMCEVVSSGDKNYRSR
jgi:DNA replication protein DnaC